MFKSLLYFLGGVVSIFIMFGYGKEIGGFFAVAIGFFGLILLERGVFVLKGFKVRQ